MDSLREQLADHYDAQLETRLERAEESHEARTTSLKRRSQRMQNLFEELIDCVQYWLMDWRSPDIKH